MHTDESQNVLWFMTTRICFEVLYGESKKGPVSSILRVDDFTILLDCGWDDNYNIELLKPIEKVSPSCLLAFQHLV